MKLLTNHGENFVKFYRKRNKSLVVFVHGLDGNNREYWGDLKTYLTAESKLHHVDFLFWRYPTNSQLYPNLFSTLRGKTKVPHVATISSELRTFLRDVQNESQYQKIAMFGHSLGGCVITEAIAAELESDPKSSLQITSLLMNATPLSPKRLARIHTKLSFGQNPQVRYIASDQSMIVNLQNNVSMIREKGVHVGYMANTSDPIVSGKAQVEFDSRYQIDGGHTWFSEIANAQDTRIRIIANWIAAHV